MDPLVLIWTLCLCRAVLAVLGYPCNLLSIHDGKPCFKAWLPWGEEEPLTLQPQDSHQPQNPRGSLSEIRSSSWPASTRDPLGLVGLLCCPGDRGHRDSGDGDSSDRGCGDGALQAKRAASPGEARPALECGELERRPDEVSPIFLQAPLAPLDTLHSWLDGMGELQASQGPLAADATLAASQLREQEV